MSIYRLKKFDSATYRKRIKVSVAGFSELKIAEEGFSVDEKERKIRNNEHILNQGRRVVEDSNQEHALSRDPGP